MNPAPNNNPNQDSGAPEADPATMDFPTLSQQVASDAEHLVESAELVTDDLAHLTTDFEWEDPTTVLNIENEIPWSPNELLARLNGIASTAYRLARSVHPLIDIRTRHLIAQADRDQG